VTRLERFRSLLDGQIEIYRRLRDAARAEDPADRDSDALDGALAEQVAVLRELGPLRRARRRMLVELAEEPDWPASRD